MTTIGQPTPTTTTGGGGATRHRGGNDDAKPVDPLTAIGIDLEQLRLGLRPDQRHRRQRDPHRPERPASPGTFAGFGLSEHRACTATSTTPTRSSTASTAKLKLIDNDDGYEPARTSQNVDELINKDGVFASSGILGTPQNLAVRDTLNEECVPHLFPSTGAPDWGDAENHPWTVGGAVIPYNVEASIWAEYLKTKYPNGTTVALLMRQRVRQGLRGLAQALHRRHQHRDRRHREARPRRCPTSATR